MEIQVGDILIGKVNQVRPYALFLSFEGGATGLLHISELSDQYIRDIETFGTIGDEIKVKVLSIDPNNGFLRVSYKALPVEERYSSHDASKKVTPAFDVADFKDIEEMLPTWIENTLKEIKGNKNDD